MFIKLQQFYYNMQCVNTFTVPVSLSRAVRSAASWLDLSGSPPPSRASQVRAALGRVPGVVAALLPRLVASRAGSRWIQLL